MDTIPSSQSLLRGTLADGEPLPWPRKFSMQRPSGKLHNENWRMAYQFYDALLREPLKGIDVEAFSLDD